MSLLRLLAAAAALLSLLALAGCPADDEGDTSVVIDRDTDATPSTTIVQTPPATPPADTDVNVNVEVPETPEPVETTTYIVVEEPVRTEYPEVVTVVERQATVLNENPDELDVLFVADSPARETWVTTIRDESAMDPTYVLEDFTVVSATDTEATATATVVVTSADPAFVARRDNVTYTLRKNDAGEWLIWDVRAVPSA